MTPLLEVRGLTVRYERQTAVDDVSFIINDGDYAAVVGENGSGKSTLVKSLVGLIPPAAGEIIMHGTEKSEIGYLPQSTIVQKDFPASVTEVVMTGCLGRGQRFWPFYTKEQKRTAADTMELLGVTPFAKKSFRELSGGQQQRVLLARALCATKKLLILDEPASVLDPVVTHELYGILHRLNEERGITVLMVSHDIHCALEQAKTILHMGQNLLYCGSAEEYHHTELYRRMTGSCGDMPHSHTHHNVHHVAQAHSDMQAHSDAHSHTAAQEHTDHHTDGEAAT
ncbi:MAG: metal ABC transporter ATP-binding protein [Clostridia bacterium]|nr:metal ABC transporter ATP-binding protein [Clostridia bacterium]